MKNIIAACIAIVISQSATAGPTPPELKLNIRAMQCDTFDFAELDSLQKDELESASCSYAVGVGIKDRSAEKVIAQQTDARIAAALLQGKITAMDKCTAGLQKVDSLFERKYPGVKIDCSKLKRKDAAAAPSAEEKPQ